MLLLKYIAFPKCFLRLHCAVRQYGAGTSTKKSVNAKSAKSRPTTNQTSKRKPQPENFKKQNFTGSATTFKQSENKVSNDNTSKIKRQPSYQKQARKDKPTETGEVRFNNLDIQMLPLSIHRQVFGTLKQEDNRLADGETATKSQQAIIQQCKEELQKTAKITKAIIEKQKKEKMLPVFNLNLPKLQGADMLEHFTKISLEQTSSYQTLAQRLIDTYTPRKDAQRAYCLKTLLEKCEMPAKWLSEPGWVRYDRSGKQEKVDVPREHVLVFDVEVLQSERIPVLATALSDVAWYVWCSPRLFEAQTAKKDKPTTETRPTASNDVHTVLLDELIPLHHDGCTQRSQSDLQLRLHNHARLVVGHNVSFDRSYVRDQYLMHADQTRFMDTMSLHIAMFGMTGEQRLLKVAHANKRVNKSVLRHFGENKTQSEKPDEYWEKKDELLKWTESTSLNNLNDVFALHAASDKGKDNGEVSDEERQKLLASFAAEKIEMRKILLDGSLEDVRTNMQSLLTYCANDVRRTLAIFCKLWPLFSVHFPHPVTLAGMLEMNTAYLPVNESWLDFVNQTGTIYTGYKAQLTNYLREFADRALSYSAEVCANGKAKPLPKTTAVSTKESPTFTSVDVTDYSKHLWLWNEDWTVRKLPSAKSKSKKSKPSDTDTKPKRHVHMPGYPIWYADLCPRKSDATEPTLSRLSTQMRITPKLLCLSWDGWPLHYEEKLGWGFLVPGFPCSTSDEFVDDTLPVRFPYDVLCNWVRPRLLQMLRDIQIQLRKNNQHPLRALAVGKHADEVQRQIFTLFADLGEPPASADEICVQLGLSTDRAKPSPKSKRPLETKNARKTESNDKHQVVPGPFFYRFGLDRSYRLAAIPRCWFFKLPHKNGPQSNVGNPLSKDFAALIPTRLRSELGADADRALELNRLCQYWTNNSKRLSEQLVVYLPDLNTPQPATSNSSTASLNSDHSHLQGAESARESRMRKIGAIIPRVVTSGTVTRRAVEPTWLTATKAHPDRIGSEQRSMIQAPPGYHFVAADVDAQELWIAALIGDAGFGEHGATPIGWLTLQGDKASGTDLHSRVAESLKIDRDRAKVLNYARFYGAGPRFAANLLRLYNNKLTEKEAFYTVCNLYKQMKGTRSRKSKSAAADATGSVTWHDGVESHMFNALERIANEKEPRTPVLNCRISESLLPENVNQDYLTSRVNWVVQSSGVDYLHLMLVAVSYLIDKYCLDARFVISVHDEIRYLVRDCDVYRFSVAMQVANLWTRAMFSERLGIRDLPLSVAFFSSIEIDKCWRKSVTDECKTPSNRGMSEQYGVPHGTSLDIYALLKLTNSGTLEKPTRRFNEPDSNHTSNIDRKEPPSKPIAIL